MFVWVFTDNVRKWDEKWYYLHIVAFIYWKVSKPEINHISLKERFTATYTHTFDEILYLIYCIYHFKKPCSFPGQKKIPINVL